MKKSNDSRKRIKKKKTNLIINILQSFHTYFKINNLKKRKFNFLMWFY